MGYKLSTAVAVFIVTLSMGQALASGCSSEAKKNESGVYTGCQVKMADKELLIGAERSSEGGCKFVCSILGEVNESRGKIKKAEHLTASAR